MSRCIVALIILLAACQPFYRDNLRAGRRAGNVAEIDKLLEKAEEAGSTSDFPRAIEFSRKAIRRNPVFSARAYVVLAVNLQRAGHASEARAIIAYAKTNFGDASVRAALATEFVRVDLVADAIDVAEVDSLAGTTSMTAFALLGDLVAAVATKDLDRALALYQRWLDSYGIPDHAILREARAQITKRVGAEIDARTPAGMRLVAIGQRANATGSLALYSLAFRVLPDDRFRAYRGGMARAASTTSDPASIDPIAWDLAVDGGAAIKQGKLGPAISAFRRAVARAPWWAAAHENLAELLALAGRNEEAELERAWVTNLTTTWIAERAETPDLDADGDHVGESKDRCPYEAEDLDGFEDDDGCPERDNDHDGVTDKSDRCPQVAEDADGFEDTDGCPEPDNDLDRIPDAADKCPLQPEIYNGTDDADGCPDDGRIVIGTTSLTVLDPITFEGRTAKLARGSSKILDLVVATLAGNSQLQIEVGVHGKVVGKPERDLVVTRARADAVVKYIVDHGIVASRLTAVGYGDTKSSDPHVELSIKK